MSRLSCLLAVSLVALCACSDEPVPEEEGYGTPPEQLDCSAEPGTTACDGHCVDLSTSQEHCGGCGDDCLAGELCTAGSCACIDATRDPCPGIGCVDLSSDPDNCGACGASCNSLEACVSGACGCASDEACPPGESCTDGVCAPDTRGPFCRPCSQGCGDELNFCAFDAGGVSFCGVDCSSGQSCPSGFVCQDLIIPVGGACATGADCTSGVCVTSPAGGVCGCAVDADCPLPRCGVDGRCSDTRVPCDAGAPCAPLSCKTITGGGACVVGRNCGPEAPLTCADL